MSAPDNKDTCRISGLSKLGTAVLCLLRAAGDHFNKFHIFNWLALVGLIIAASEFIEANQNSARQAQYQAWHLLNTSKDVRGNGGRTLALQRLAADRISLEDVDLSNANISTVEAGGANLSGGRFDSIIADYGNFKRANLERVSAKNAYFRWSCFGGARLIEANFVKATLTNADFRGADLRRADLRGANLANANFDKADLSNADLSGAEIVGASFKGANLVGATLRDLGSWRLAADMTGMNFRSARTLPEGFTETVKSRWAAYDDFNLADSEWILKRDGLDYKTDTGRCGK